MLVRANSGADGQTVQNRFLDCPDGREKMAMKRSTKKILGMAAGSALLSGSLFSHASGATSTWLPTATVGSQDSNWSNAANWNPGVPGANDLALIPVTPPANTINVATATSVGGIQFNAYGTTGTVAIPTQSLTGSGVLTLSGATMTISQFSGTVTQSNVVLATGLGSTFATTGALTVSNPLALSGAQDYFVGFTSTSPNSASDIVNLNGNISNSGATAAQEIFYGGGTRTRFGAQFNVNANNTVSGGIVISNTLGTEGAVLNLASPSALPTTGTITINEQGQLLFGGNGTYGTGMTMYLNGPGVGPGISGGSSGALRTGNSNIVWAGNLIIGSATSGDPTLSNYGQVVISSTGSNTLNLTGAISGTGFLSKQGGGLLTISNAAGWSGPTNGIQNGNGSVQINAGADYFGDIGMYASSTNKPIDILLDPNQGIRNLFSNFVSTSGAVTPQAQFVDLGAAGGSTVLTINQTVSNQFGYKDTVTGGALTTTIQDNTGSVASGNQVIYHGNPGISLSLTGPNTYSGGTQVTQGILNLANGVIPNNASTGESLGLNGSALGSGAVTVGGSGILTSGGGVQVLSLTSTIGGFSGNLTVNNGGHVSPGGTSTSGLTGTLDVGGNVTANAGSNFDFNLAGGDSATNSLLAANGNLTLDGSGNETINVFGSKLAVGTYDLFNFNAGIAGTLKQFTLGTTPGGTGRSYSLSALTAGSTSEDLIIVATNTERFWSVPSGAAPSASTDGGGTWQNGSTTFYNDVPPPGPSQPGAAYDSNATADVVFGSGGAGGTVTLTGAVTVKGSLSFQAVTAPYTIASSAPGNTLTLVGGIGGSASANITAPIVLQGSQQFTAGSGTLLSVTGGISESAPGTTLTVGGDIGTVVLGGSNSYTGGTVINLGTLQTSTGSLPVTGGAQVNSGGNLAFAQPSNGSYTGTISGSGNVSVNGTGTVTLAPTTSNTYSGSTNLQAGVLNISSTGALGTGAGGINFTGGTLQFAQSMNFPIGIPAQTIQLVSGNSDVDTPLSTTTVTMNQGLTGSGNLNKSGPGTVIFTGLPATTVIGQLGISGGNLEFDPTSNTTYGFFSSTSPGTYAGNLLLAGSLEVRLQGGLIDGGGNVEFLSSGINFVSHGALTVNNTILINPFNIGGFVANLGATNMNTLTINSVITGSGDVDFTAGAGDTYLQYSYASGGGYTGATTIDNGSAGAVHLAVNDALPTTTDVHITGSGVLDVDGTTDTIASLDSGAPPTGAKIENTSLNAATLIVNGSKNTNFAGYILDNVGNVVTPGGPLTIELGSAYTGTLHFNSTTYNSYNGGTVIDGGTLLVDPGSLGVDDMLGNSGSVTFGGGTLAINAPWTSARPIVVNPGSSTINGQGANTASLTPASISWNGGTLNLSNLGMSSLQQNGGTVSVTPGSALAIDSATSLAVTGTTDPFTDHANANNHVAIVNNGTLSFAGLNSSIAGITGSGVLDVGDGTHQTTLQLAQNSGGSNVGTLAISANAALDITNNHLIINYGTGTDPISSVHALLLAGFNGGQWNGRTGITSSTAASTPGYSVGYADAADTGNPAGLATGTIEVKYTLIGDADLNGTVNGIDFGILAANFNKTVTGWDKGDFDYNNIVNGLDFTALASNFNKATSGADGGATAADFAALEQFAAANGLLADVPEPGSIALLAVGTAGLMARRRRAK
jgi:autotransporter-associated beta strand protein